MVEVKNSKVCLTIAGLDPSGGAGIIADVITLAAFDCVAVAAVTSITYQNARGVFGAVHQTRESIRGQLKPIFDENDVAAVKAGMLPTAEIVNEVAAQLRSAKISNLVVDPVIRSTSGFDLINDDAILALAAELFPLAALVTPNIPEAERLTGITIKTEKDIADAASLLRSKGAKNVLIKGGHFDMAGALSRDFLFLGGNLRILETERIQDSATRGTGCMLSSAIAANLALGRELKDAVSSAKEFVVNKIRAANSAAG